MQYDVAVIGAGISGLTAASLLAKKGLKVAVIDKSYNPGGSSGIFKRKGITFDKGAAMLFGFGDKGFNAHRFVFNCLEEPVKVIKHELLYTVNFKGNKIRFWADIPRFAEELSTVFPAERDNIFRFYSDLEKMYQKVMVENPSYTTPDETDPGSSLKSLLRHPLYYLRFISYLNKSAKSLLKKYFKDPEIFQFFDKLTSTYCYTTVEESPAILAAVMFVDNHIGGSYYPAGSTIFLTGKLEKAIEENGGDMVLEKEVTRILFDQKLPAGLELHTGEKIYADHIIYSGTVWNLYGKLVDEGFTTDSKLDWAQSQVPTYPSVILYAYVKEEAIPGGTSPIEMLVGNPESIDESEVTVYIPSLEDKTLAPPDGHVVMAIGPTFESWDKGHRQEYLQKKQKETQRLIAVLEKRFPGLGQAVIFSELATPCSIERYTLKNKGAVAGPKQMLGQHMFKRLHTRTEWNNFFCCGESTVMGTGTPTVTTSGISAANAVLKKLGKKTWTHQDAKKNYVSVVNGPVTGDDLYDGYSGLDAEIMKKAAYCQYCENPTCSEVLNLDIRGIMMRATVGNFTGARKIIERFRAEKDLNTNLLADSEKLCIQNQQNKRPVQIQAVIDYIGRK